MQTVTNVCTAVFFPVDCAHQQGSSACLSCCYFSWRMLAHVGVEPHV